ncbi:hypothetical protein Halru_1464 [Halovivax ruber XH-70]|uniref:SPW repeat protein n=1 Tax=Halovivax ruber (strain DSM 18193 / JCM 13892 / XH-70) TaxID=797302 RepID=L0IBD5_HALRX|nr:hypothetical protein [Halovivax ruber]AGB16074.1 hypothetical protein Halru_1464 [Halovivax ruber XH-70]
MGESENSDPVTDEASSTGTLDTDGGSSDQPADSTTDEDSVASTSNEDSVATTSDEGTLESTSVEQTASDSDAATTDPDSTFAGRNAVRAAGLVAGLGVFLFWGPVLFTGAGLTMWMQFGLGLTIAIAGSVTAMKHGEGAAAAIGLPLLAAVMGILVVALPQLTDVHSATLEVVNSVAGIVVILLALLVIFGFRKDAAEQGGRATPSR